MLKARLNPEAKKPPKGARMEAKMARGTECNTAGYIDMVAPSPNYTSQHNTVLAIQPNVYYISTV